MKHANITKGGEHRNPGLGKGMMYWYCFFCCYCCVTPLIDLTCSILLLLMLLQRCWKGKREKRPKQGEKKVRSPRAPNQHDIFSDTPNTKTSKQAVFLSLILFLFGEQTIFEFQYFLEANNLWLGSPPRSPLPTKQALGIQTDTEPSLGEGRRRPLLLLLFFLLLCANGITDGLRCKKKERKGS